MRSQSPEKCGIPDAPRVLGITGRQKYAEVREVYPKVYRYLYSGTGGQANIDDKKLNLAVVVMK